MRQYFEGYKGSTRKYMAPVSESKFNADVMEFKDKPLGKPSETEVAVQHKAIGLNFIDIYHRRGIYPIPLPSGLGMEASGIVLEVGEKVKH